MNKRIIVCLSLITTTILFLSCSDTITDFGFDAGISGQIVDQSGNIVSGDITSSDFRVLAHGERDEIPMELRIRGDGTYANTHLYPQSYRVWVEGPVISTDEITADLSDGTTLNHDFVVVPYLTIPTPELIGNPTSSEITIGYNIIENEGNVTELRQIYVSTIPHPTHSTGSGVGWTTQTVEMDDNVGTITISGLESNTRYFVRIGARAEGTSSRNFSDHLVVETP